MFMWIVMTNPPSSDFNQLLLLETWFGPRQLRCIERMIQENQRILLEGWNEHLRRLGWGTG